MVIAILFWTLSILSCVYAFFTGGREGKWAALVIICASAASMVGPETKSWIETQLAVALVDTVTLAAMTAIALHSRAYWPIWMAAFQLNTVATHLATFIAQDYGPALYQGLGGFWAIPGQIAMVIGIFLDNRSGWYWRNETPA